MARCIPSKTRNNPFPPESTTPACLSTGSNSGVRNTDSSAAATMCASMSRISRVLCAADSAATPISRATVRMVPSTGAGTALYAASAASRSACARSCVVMVAFSRRLWLKPCRICPRITPELPRDP